MLRCIVFTTLAAFVAAQFLATPHAAFAAPQAAKPKKTLPNEIEIPQIPSAPPVLHRSAPPDPFHCHRRFVYQGKAMDCDTHVRRDGENLRPIIQDVPAAVSELDAYQKGRRNLRYSAYAASAGIGLALLGYLYNMKQHEGQFRIKENPTADNSPLILTYGAYLIMGGAVLTVGSFTFGFAVHKTNESHLTEAVNQFNLARPNTPIELEFKTGISF